MCSCWADGRTSARLHLEPDLLDYISGELRAAPILRGDDVDRKQFALRQLSPGKCLTALLNGHRPVCVRSAWAGHRFEAVV